MTKKIKVIGNKIFVIEPIENYLDDDDITIDLSKKENAFWFGLLGSALGIVLILLSWDIIKILFDIK